MSIGKLISEESYKRLMELRETLPTFEEKKRMANFLRNTSYGKFGAKTYL